MQCIKASDNIDLLCPASVADVEISVSMVSDKVNIDAVEKTITGL